MPAARKIIEVVGAIIVRGNCYLVGKRPAGKSQAGLWEFMGGKIEPGETPEQALVRECREELALEIVPEGVLGSVVHDYPEKTVRLTLIRCHPAPGSEPTALEHEQILWVRPGELRRLPLCPADAELAVKIFGSDEKR